MPVPQMNHNEEKDWTEAVWNAFLECQHRDSDPGKLSELNNAIEYGSPVEVRKARTWVIRSMRRAAEEMGTGGRTLEQVYGLAPGMLRPGWNFEPRWSCHLP